MPGELKAEYWRKKIIKNNIAKISLKSLAQLDKNLIEIINILHDFHFIQKINMGATAN
jgi:hypothetical protein